MNSRAILPLLLPTISFIILLPTLTMAASCLKGGCHQDLTKLKHLHGPIGAEMAGVQGCTICHAPAGQACSPSASGQFKLKSKEMMCQTCHDKNLGNQHTNDATPCLKCHSPTDQA